MPLRPKRPCRHAMCPALTDDGYCDAHKRDRHQYDRHRGSSHERGYDYQWRQFRLRYLSQHPLCIDCLDREHVKPAEHVHHIAKLAEHPELKYVDGNLMALCESCHDARSARGE